MDQGLLVLILSVLVFVAGALFINFSVKREEARDAAKAQQAQQPQAVAEMKKAA